MISEGKIDEYVASTGVYYKTLTDEYYSGEWSAICDAGSKPEKDTWHDVLHDHVVFDDAPMREKSASFCSHDMDYRPNTTMPARFTTPYADLPLMSDILASDEFQEAFEGALDEWYTKLYSFHPEQLPDMSVFMVELRETMGMANLIYDYAKQLRGLLMRRKVLRKRLGQIDLDIGKSIKKRRFVKARRLELEKKSLAEALNDLSNFILSWRFGVKAPIRDVVKMVASLYSKWDSMSFCPTTEHCRRSFQIQMDILDNYWQASDCFHCNEARNGNCNAASGARPGDQFTKVKRSVEGMLCITSNFTNSLVGSDVEQIGYALLSQMRLVPDLRSIWEMTKLSWALDYFVRLNSYFVRHSVKLGLGFQHPVVSRQCISLKVMREAQRFGEACPRQTWIYNYGPVRQKHYERIVGVSPIEFTDLVRFVRSPSFNQGVNAAALALQMLTGAHLQ
jgi:hypothetical protein